MSDIMLSDVMMSDVMLSDVIMSDLMLSLCCDCHILLSLVKLYWVFLR
jgi:hypothetical protein